MLIIGSNRSHKTTYLIINHRYLLLFAELVDILTESLDRVEGDSVVN